MSDPAWFRSGYSSDEGGNCLDVAHDRRTSRHSAGEGGNCLERAASPAALHIQDSEDPHGPVLTLPAVTWGAFLADVVGRP
ncbi:DUF397 domain-containing protein [Streptomyces sp. RS10V-4]|uniref:DUF397 domain-containing protein n=1 Tax=Streptomyces rhizoryzae TaxID=2932493 RepID=UPI0020051D2D|nr:DUF397 domain-containing protein [Streptomyces rhizoryzae]MCK7626642.1 DUF397 domain-containing protein [Streptomyces rhizoryzae]